MLPTTTARASGESRGVQPHWQEEWRMCLHKLRFFTPPFLKGRGPGGWSGPALRRVQAGSPEGCNPTGRRNGGCASINYVSLLPPSFQEGGQGDGAVPYRGEAPNRSRSPEGAVLWRGHWGCPPDLIITPPFLSGRGLGGWSDPLSRRSSESQQESRGRRPLAGALGVSPRTYYYSPLSFRKGARGMVRSPIEAKLTRRGSPSGSRRAARPGGSLQ